MNLNIDEATILAIQGKLNENFINNLTDEDNPTVLYHFTKPDALRPIFIQNKLVSMDRDQVSFTTDNKYYTHDFQMDHNRRKAVLVIDAIKLSQNYNIERFIDENYPEEQEWIIQGEVLNIKDYILYLGNIDIPDYIINMIKKLEPDILIKDFK